MPTYSSHPDGPRSSPDSAGASASRSGPPRAKKSKRRLGLDPGEARIGVAISDELGLFAHPRGALSARDRQAVLKAIGAIVEEEDISAVYVGLPLTLAGGASTQTGEARRFAADLQAVLRVPVRTCDERLTTVEARRRGRARSPRDGSLDSRAAAIMLQAVLDGERER